MNKNHVMVIENNSIVVEQNWRKLLPISGPRLWRTLVTWFMVMGPGVLVMMADNDAGGISTYAISGVKYGYNLIWLMLLLLPVAYLVQEMTVRLGAVTGRGHAELIHLRFGKFWGYFSLADLFIGNILTMVTEFIGMAAALSVFGVPIWAAVLLSVALTTTIALTGRYWTFERIALVFAAVNLVYIPLVFLVHPSTSEVLKAIATPKVAGGFTTSFLFLIIANIGTTIAPWMLFFQQSAVVDKQLEPSEICYGRWDTFIGAIGTQVVAIAIMITMAATLHANGIVVKDAGEAATALIPFAGRAAGAMLALGLFDAGFLGTICLSLSTAWAFGEVFGWAHSLNHRVKEAPWFYILYFAGILVAAIVVLVPGAPLDFITLAVQVMATLFLPPALGFLVLLLNDSELMGDYVNSLSQNIYTWVIVVAVLVLSTLYGLTAIFPNLIPQ